MELEEVLSEGDNEDEVDDEVADFEELRRLGNFDNVTIAEKKFMHMVVLAWLSIIAHRNKDKKVGKKLISMADVVKEHWTTYGRNSFLDMTEVGVIMAAIEECESEGANKMVAYLRETTSKSKTGDKF
ncbi:hypothetical protein Ahy_A03g012917 [Arachis hypogaea]|uniref:Polycomb protein VEFS-Box domain-containing protein n=1 Tax=Arachis hypogaea TaxID=3818 RepID=A0A445DUF7_ARAHY|nr:hypothetical protein Ahy_A03g012917 [Arachis hypogaea]